MTIVELRRWYVERHLPPYEVTRFFIGENCTEPRAYGIYKKNDTGTFVVYKNKSDGSRAIRYEGTNEAYAVNQLLEKMKEEISLRKRKGRNWEKPVKGDSFENAEPAAGTGRTSDTNARNSRKRKSCLGRILHTVFVLLLVFTILAFALRILLNRVIDAFAGRYIDLPNLPVISWFYDYDDYDDYYYDDGYYYDYDDDYYNYDYDYDYDSSDDWDWDDDDYDWGSDDWDSDWDSDWDDDWDSDW